MGTHIEDDVSDTPKRLTILVTSTQRRGAEVFGERLAAGLPERGWQVDFVALGRHSGSSSSVDAHPLSESMVGRLDLGVVRLLRRRLRSHRPHVVLANGSSTLHYGVAATRTMARRPRLVYSSIGEPSFWANTPRKRFAYRGFLALVDHVYSVSTPTAAQLTTQFGVSQDRVRILPTGVPDTMFDVDRQPHDPPMRILFLGSLSTEKDPMAAVAVLNELTSDTPAVLRMVGAGPLEAAVTAAARSAGSDAVVELAGSVPDVRPHLAWADVLLLTSRTEGLPAATLEAAAAGIPSVAFDVGGVSETVVPGVTGQLVRAGDSLAAAAALRAYALDPPARRAAGEAARAMAERTFTMAAAIERYDEALTDLAQDRGSKS